ncbi:amino acid permease/ SLC12A domain-containing protein [Chytriomyces sp. MP71]|nr:amino acid permease/ SLC12A domain-containing protein [Chytriomyces sp. MP71]
MADDKKIEPAVFETETTGHLHRKLQARHLEMIAIGGTIGTGLLLRSGGAIAGAGPLGALICFGLVGLQVYGVTAGIGEMVTYIPVEGAFSQLPARFVSPALGFASGWNYWLNWALTFPAEMSGIASLMGYWVDPSRVASAVWSFIFMVPIIAVNCFPVTGFAETEFVLCIIKVLAIVIFLIVGILVWFGVGVGGGFKGFSNWNPAIVGDTSMNQFLNVGNGFTTAFFSYGGTELVGLTSGEAANPRKSVPRAINGTFYRIIIFYLGALFLVGVLLNPSDPILQAADIKTSPFVWVYNQVGIGAGADIMNFVIIVAASSAANSSIYACARTLMRLAEEGSAPRIFGRVDKRGVPIISVGVVGIVGLIAVVIAYASGSSGSVDVFNFLSGVISYGILAAWMIMSFTHLRFRRGYLAQGRDIKDLPYVAPFFPYLNYLSLTIGTVVTIFMLISVFNTKGADAATFFNKDWFTNQSWVYIGFPGTFIMYLGYGLARPGGWKFVSYEDMDFETGKYVELQEELAEIAAVHEKPKSPREWAQRIWFKLF